jgi:hypothetical protein
VEVLATTKMASSTSSDEDDGSWAGADFSRLNDPGALCYFVGICDQIPSGPIALPPFIIFKASPMLLYFICLKYGLFSGDAYQP